MRTQQGGADCEGAGERQEATESSLSINTYLHNLVFDDPETIQMVQQLSLSRLILKEQFCRATLHFVFYASSTLQRKVGSNNTSCMVSHHLLSALQNTLSGLDFTGNT